MNLLVTIVVALPLLAGSVLIGSHFDSARLGVGVWLLAFGFLMAIDMMILELKKANY